ncbi:BRCA1 C Terminus (BRCT) domain [Trypanosoma vivax]|uniref:BRCT domain-containing protein n=1 Tax=Trypanosoma vivax (strain Y486) TaxID=1055687 RepID=G0TTA6_TRYVY|nr:hypothetical protein TRVL_06102 [Trypanosoma vivax]KAH8605498.1 BRCA1 C Terminus (BRCT) domain [Trypanosoma vivax]CCC47187.1 conserved hypothetical protein [Trypanosoma vivax Y486]
MFVTTTGIRGDDLELIKTKLTERGMVYTSELSTLTRVLVAKNAEGLKYQVARERGIPCVTPVWVLSGCCSTSQLDDYSVGKSLLGLEICTARLGEEEQNHVKHICRVLQAKYTPILTANCAFLVVPSMSSGMSESRKFHFARKHRISIKLYHDFLREYDTEVRLRHGRGSLALLPSPQGSRMVVHCTPSNLLSGEVLSLLERAGMQHGPKVTLATTHVVFIGPVTELYAPRPGLEFVSLEWLRECAAQEHGRVAVEPYRMPNVQRPVITFTGVPLGEREALRISLVQSGLPCDFQDEFVLGARALSSDSHRNTTHLIVGCPNPADSSKVAALAWRVYKLRILECFLVSTEWLRQSIVAGTWVDCGPFSVKVPSPSAFTRGSRSEECTASVPYVKVRVKGPTNEGENALRKSSHNVHDQSDSTPSNSLETMIEELESKVSTTACVSVTPEVDMPRTSCPLFPHDNPIWSHSCRCLPLSLPASATYQKTRPCKLQEESQVIVYRTADLEQPWTPNLEAKQSTGRPQMIIFSGSEQSESCNIARAGCVGSSPRYACCILLARSLQNMNICFTRLQALGCTVAKTVDECTHYITEKPSRTEVFLCAVSAGKWVLAPSFIKETLRGHRLVDEKPHEWTPQMAREALLSSSVVEFVRACQLQRCRPERPFATWGVALCCASESRTASFSHVLRSGGCQTVMTFSPPKLLDSLGLDDSNFQKLTLVLSDGIVWSGEQLNALSVRLPVLRIEYVAHALCVMVPNASLYEVHPGITTRKRSRSVT